MLSPKAFSQSAAVQDLILIVKHIMMNQTHYDESYCPISVVSV